jgi:hypothetical protein
MLHTGTAFPMNATGNVGNANVSYQLMGFYVSATGTGVIALRRGGSGGTLMQGAANITPAVGWNAFPADCPGGLHMTLVSGTIEATFFANPVSAA